MSDNPYGNSNPYDTGGGTNPYGQNQDPPSPYTSGAGAGGPEVLTIDDPYQPGAKLKAIRRSSLQGRTRTSLAAPSVSSLDFGVSEETSSGGKIGAVVFLLFAALFTFNQAGFIAAILAAALMGVSRSRYLSSWASNTLNLLIVYMVLALVCRLGFGFIDLLSTLNLREFSLFWLRIICTLVLLAFAGLAFLGRSLRLPSLLNLVGR